MPALSAYTNTENTALVILKDLGYRCWYDQEAERCCCEKDGWDFAADGFTELLGVVRIYEYHQPKEYREYWWKIDEPWLKDSVPTEAPDYTPVWKASE
jgi:hypothetical protein